MPSACSVFRHTCLLIALLAPAANASAPTSRPVSLAIRETPDVAPVGERHVREQHALTLARELAFGSNGMYLGLNALYVPWASTITLPASEATTKQNGLCTFRAQYYVRNLGLLTSIPTQNTIRRDTSGGTLLSSVAMGALPYTGLFNNSSDIVLAPGSWQLFAKIDAPNTNAEYYENNNLKQVQVIVSGSCN